MPVGPVGDTPTCSVEVLFPLLDGLRHLQVDVDCVLERAGLTASMLREVALRIPVAQALRTWDVAYEEANEPALGLCVLEQLDLSKFSLMTYLSATSATPRDAWERATRYVRIANDAIQVDVTIEEPHTIVRMALRGFERSRSETEFAVGLMVKLAPRVTDDLPNSEAWFRHARPDYGDRYSEVLGCAVRFDAPYDALVGPCDGIDAPLLRADSELCALLEERARELLARIPPIDDFAGVVRQHIVAALPDGNPSAEAIAEALGVSTRTLRRRLKGCGTSHQKLLDHVRHELALTAFSQRGVSINEVAFLLGFSDASAFCKAFRRWTGNSPGDALRAQAR